MARAAVPEASAFEFPITQVGIADFRDATGDTDSRRMTLCAGATDHVVAPPTFPISSERHRPDSPLRPPLSGPTAMTGRSQLPHLHAAQSFRYRRYPRVGENLTVTIESGCIRTKSARAGGSITFREYNSRYNDHDGNEVLSTTWTDAHTPAGQSIALPRDEDPGPSDTSHDALADQLPIDTALRSTRTALVLPRLTVSHLVRYAAASGDFVAVHHDHHTAVEQGFPTVFAPGMFTFGKVAHALEHFFGKRSVFRLEAQFRRPYFIGRPLITTVTYDPSGAVQFTASDGAAGLPPLVIGTAHIRSSTTSQSDVG